MLVNVGKRVMAYTMPGPQANRETMAGRPLVLATPVNTEKRDMEEIPGRGPAINMREYLNVKKLLVQVPMIKLGKHSSAPSFQGNPVNGNNGTKDS